MKKQIIFDVSGCFYLKLSENFYFTTCRCEMEFFFVLCQIKNHSKTGWLSLSPCWLLVYADKRLSDTFLLANMKQVYRMISEAWSWQMKFENICQCQWKLKASSVSQMKFHVKNIKKKELSFVLTSLVSSSTSMHFISRN